MPTVEFIYERTCPFITAARRQMIEAFGIAGATPSWTEWETGDPEAAAHVRGYGSPTILVDGKDVSGVPQAEASACCRIYTLQGEQRGVPPLDKIVAALGDATVPVQRDHPPASAVRLNAALLPSIGVALLPKITCPLCWPAYAGLLSSLGVGFVDYTPYLLPLTVTFLAIAVGALAYRASARRGYGPFILGVVGAVVALAGMFGFGSDPVAWGGLGVLVVASVWNTWPVRRKAPSEDDAACPACVQANA